MLTLSRLKAIIETYKGKKSNLASTYKYLQATDLLIYSYTTILLSFVNTLSVLKRLSQEAVHGSFVKQSFNKYSTLPRNLSRSDPSSSLVTKSSEGCCTFHAGKGSFAGLITCMFPLFITAAISLTGD